LLRLKIVSSRTWTGYLVISIALAISAIYELIEWWTALLTGESQRHFGHPGLCMGHTIRYVLAFAGSLAAVVLFSKYHDRRIKETEEKQELVQHNA